MLGVALLCAACGNDARHPIPGRDTGGASISYSKDYQPDARVLLANAPGRRSIVRHLASGCSDEARVALDAIDEAIRSFRDGEPIPDSALLRRVQRALVRARSSAGSVAVRRLRLDVDGYTRRIQGGGALECRRATIGRREDYGSGIFIGYPAADLCRLCVRDTVVALVIRPRDDAGSCDASVWALECDTSAMIDINATLRPFGGAPGDILDSLLSPFVETVFGYECGYILYPIADRVRWDRTVHERDTAELRRWLGALNPEMQAYGAQGLLVLARLGMELSAADSSAIERFRRSRLCLVTCSGCMVGDSITAADALDTAVIAGTARLMRDSGAIVRRW